MSAKFVIANISFVLLVLAWLSFAFLMRDTDLIAKILGYGLVGVLAAGYLIFTAASDSDGDA